MYTFKNIPAHDEKPFMFNSNNTRSSVHHVLAQFVRSNGVINNFTVSWNDVMRDLMKASSFGGELVSFSGLRELGPTIYSAEDSDIEKAKKIFDWTKAKNSLEW